MLTEKIVSVENIGEGGCNFKLFGNNGSSISFNFSSGDSAQDEAAQSRLQKFCELMRIGEFKLEDPEDLIGKPFPAMPRDFESGHGPIAIRLKAALDVFTYGIPDQMKLPQIERILRDALKVAKSSEVS